MTDCHLKSCPDATGCQHPECASAILPRTDEQPAFTPSRARPRLKNERRALLRNADFKRYILARFLGSLAVQMQTVAVGCQVYEVKEGTGAQEWA